MLKLSEILLNLFQNNKEDSSDGKQLKNKGKKLLELILEEEDLDLIDFKNYKLTKLTTQPSKLKRNLTSYQLEGLNWMINLIESGFNGILADEMGLGKTIQSIALISYLKDIKKKSKFLVVAPKSVLSNWQKEFKIWAPDIKVVLLISVKGQREAILEKFVKTENFDVILTSYEGNLNN